MQSQNNPVNAEHDKLDKPLDLGKIFHRILPYWYIVVLSLIISFVVARLYLRYAIPDYLIKSKVVVTDEQNSGGGNLFEAIQGNFRDLDRATEKELANLQSKSLITDVVNRLQLNVQWNKIGRIREAPVYDDLAIKLILGSPDSVRETISGYVTMAGRVVSFNGVQYFLDSTYNTSFGTVRWTLENPKLLENHEWELIIEPVRRVANDYLQKLDARPINKQSAIVDVSVTDVIPKRGVIFLEELLKSHAAKNLDFKKRTFENTLRFVESRLALLSKELGEVEGELETLKSKKGIIDLGSEGQIFLQQIGDIDKNISEIDIKLDVLGKIEQYVNNRNQGDREIPATLGLEDPILSALLTQLFQAEFEVDRLEKVSGKKNPELLVLQGSINKLKPSILSSINNLKFGLTAAKSKLKTDERRFSGMLKDIPQKERALLEISRQQQIKNNIYLFLLEKREEAALNSAAQVSTLTVIDQPESGGQKSPKPQIAYLIAWFIGLASAGGIIWLKEFSRNRVIYKDDLERETGLVVMGELQMDDSHKDSLVDFSARSLLAEQFREFRTNLSYISTQPKGGIYLVTSSVPGEGKSFVSANLGASLALTGKRVVLLEFDLRKPKLSKYLKVKRSQGITSYLIGTGPSLKELIVPISEIDNFYLLPSGPLPPNPVELILNQKNEELFSELRKMFDVILIDSPPIGSVTEAKLLAKYADATLYIVRYDYTSMDLTKMIKDVAQKQQLPKPYLVLNAIRSNKHGKYGYNYGYGYGYGYGYVNSTKRGAFAQLLENLKKKIRK